MNARTVYTNNTVIRSRRSIFRKAVSSCVAFLILMAMVMSTLITAGAGVALADDAPGADFSGCPDDSRSDADARQACGIKNQKSGDKSVGDSNNNYNQMFKGGYSNIMDDDTANAGLTDAWSMMMYRIINPSYYLNSGISTDAGQLNTQHSAVHAWKPNRSCPSLDKKDDYTNDNCDVPGITTQALQSLMYGILPPSISGGEKVSAKSPFNIGIPTDLIPGGSVPVNRGSNKYTALEIFGYNLNWSSYNGEWDKIDVLTVDRLTSDMSISDNISAAFQSVSSGISKAAGNASADVADAWNSKNLVSIAGSILAWPFKTMFNSTTNSVYNYAELMMNGYEKNIFDSNAWNRNAFYNDTAYNIRVLSDTEKTNVYLALVQTIIEASYAAIADQYHIDINDVESQAAFPGKGPGSAKDGDPSESSLWESWVSANKGKLEWGKSNLGVDYGSYSPSKGMTAAAEYSVFKSDWNSKAVPWKTAQIKEKLKGNLDAFYQAWLGEAGSGARASSAKAQAKALISNNSLFWVCTNDDGSAQGSNDNPVIKLAIQGGLRDPGLNAFDAKGNYQCKDASGTIGDIRPPISGALFGQQGTGEQKTKHADTRRDMSLTLSSLLGNPLAGFAQFGLSISQKVAMLINYLVNLSFQPILSSLGIKAVVINVIRTLKNSMYMPLIEVFVVIGVLVAFIKAIRGHTIEGIKAIFLIFMTVVLGVILLYSPESAFKLVDDYPSYIERAAAAMILQTSSSPNSDICTSTASPTKSIDASQYTSLNGGSAINFNPDSTVRMVECNIWDAYVFEPWVMGQFGTGYAQLYATDHAPASPASAVKVDEATKKLVGSAPVDMGGGTTINNWALYQLSKQVAGTSTTDDTTQSVGTIDKNLYRLVDIQAGVDNAAGKDTSHWDWWKGSNQRVLIAGLAIASSVGGLFSIGLFAITKIEVTIVMSILLAMAPFMLLIGIIPGSGRNKMKSWMYKIVSLALKRVILVVLLSIQLVIMTLVAASKTDVLPGMMFMTAMSIIFSMYGKSIIKAFVSPVEHMGGNESFMDIDKMAATQIRNSRFMTNVRSTRTAFSNLGGALVGSAIVGGFVGQNSSQAIFSRYESKQRASLDKKHRDSLDDINGRRAQFMQAYRNGTLTGKEYEVQQGILNQEESDANDAYREGTRHITDYDHDFSKRREILGNPEYREEMDGIKQLKRVATRSISLGGRRNLRNGNVPVFRDAISAVGALKKEQINDAYRRIFDDNPEVGAALLGVNSTARAKELGKMVKDVDFTKIADELRLKAGMSAEDTVDEMDRLGISYRRTNNGEYIPILPAAIKSEFRRASIDTLQKDDLKRGNTPGYSHSKSDKLTSHFRKEDAIEKKKAEAIDIAQNYLPKDEQQNKSTRTDMNDAVLRFGSLYDRAKNGDAANASDIEHQKSYDKIIDNDLNKTIHDITYDDSMSEESKKDAIAKAKAAAGAERNKHVPSTDYVIGQASEAARKEMMKIIDENPHVSFVRDKDGKFGFTSSSPTALVSSADANAAKAALPHLEQHFDNYVAMKTYTSLQTSVDHGNKSKSKEDPKAKGTGNKHSATAVIDIANQKVDDNVARINAGDNEYGKKTYGTKMHNPLAEHHEEKTILEKNLKHTATTGSMLTSGRTNKQRSEDTDAARERLHESRRNPYRNTAHAKVVDHDVAAEEYRANAEEYTKKTGRSGNRTSRTTSSGNKDK